MRGRRLQQARQRLFADEPWCRLCKNRLATIRDHVIPLAEGGTEATENIQPLCQECSDRKSQQEAVRGRRRGHDRGDT
jgi:5-methylcytosine-specific restriction protein A